MAIINGPFSMNQQGDKITLHFVNEAAALRFFNANEVRTFEQRLTAHLYEAEEGSDDPRAIQGGGGARETFYKAIKGTRRRIEAYKRAHYNRYGDTLVVRYRP